MLRTAGHPRFFSYDMKKSKCYAGVSMYYVETPKYFMEFSMCYVEKLRCDEGISKYDAGNIFPFVRNV